MWAMTFSLMAKIKRWVFGEDIEDGFQQAFKISDGLSDLNGVAYANGGGELHEFSGA